MNIVLFNPFNTVYFIASVRKENGFSVITKKVSKEGILLARGSDFKFELEREAEQRVRDIIKIKIKKKGLCSVDLDKLPLGVVNFLEVPTDMMVTPDEMMLIIKEAQSERYVIFRDTTGLEEYFDKGIEYLGYLTDDVNTLRVCDKLGLFRECFVQRFQSIALTERAIDLRMKDLRNAGDQSVKNLVIKT